MIIEKEISALCISPDSLTIMGVQKNGNRQNTAHEGHQAASNQMDSLKIAGMN